MPKSYKSEGEKLLWTRHKKMIPEYSTLRDVDLPRLKWIDVKYEKADFNDLLLELAVLSAYGDIYGEQVTPTDLEQKCNSRE